MRSLNPLVILLSLILGVTTAFSQASVSTGVSYGSFNYDISGTKYTGDEIAGIVVTHKSNLMPIRKDNKQAAVDAASMRR